MQSGQNVIETIGGFFSGGSRYQTEKIAVVVVYVLIVVATVIWVGMSPDSENELGAGYGFEILEPLNQQIFFLENKSDEDWNNVRVVLNRNYLYKVETIEAGARRVLRPDDFTYYYWVPRPWGRDSWETLETDAKPDSTGPMDLKPKLLEVRANEGRINIEIP
ncbi:hypothetical protein FRD01_00990 [Microvenator marinus]|uniref:Uncharacterized protein n=1 Tax=Microvenator marinus TaxID=2600177 RepID=A0A5B8XL74_9DELT|nr:hypothetical protein [Microvenator marinus]QED25861.1 hypothetical protein FRD01_00990 [Microvenator marinus]